MKIKQLEQERANARFNLNLLECDIVKLSITLDTLTARIMKLSSDSQS